MDFRNERVFILKKKKKKKKNPKWRQKFKMSA